MTEADNTPRENKNNYLLRHLAGMVSRNKFRFVGYNFSRVGHTHGILGAFDPEALSQTD